MDTAHILYNARCPICRAEIAHYERRAEAAGAPLRFEDLNSVALEDWHLTPDQAKRRMHARLPDGRIVSGAPAFALIWERLPGMGWMARAIRLPVIRGLAALAYNRVLAPWLYRRHLRREALAADRAQP